jgi:hydrogenase maturation protease
LKQTDHSYKMVDTIVMGIGNLLLGDEGVGVHAAQALMKMDLPDAVEVLDVGTALLDALPALENKKRVIILDAMQAKGKPGTIYRTLLEHCQQNQRIDSMHSFDLFRMLAFNQNDIKPEVIVLGVEPAIIEWGLELSPEVYASFPFLIEAVLKEVRSKK